MPSSATGTAVGMPSFFSALKAVVCPVPGSRGHAAGGAFTSAAATTSMQASTRSTISPASPVRAQAPAALSSAFSNDLSIVASHFARSADFPSTIFARPVARQLAFFPAALSFAASHWSAGSGAAPVVRPTSSPMPIANERTRVVVMSISFGRCEFAHRTWARNVPRADPAAAGTAGAVVLPPVTAGYRADRTRRGRPETSWSEAAQSSAARVSADACSHRSARRRATPRPTDL